MNSTRNKRWNGNIGTLPAEYLKSVIAKMMDYGDRVQLSLVSGGPQPNYQIMNAFGKKMAFDKNHHLLQAQEDDFSGPNITPAYTLDQVKAAIAGVAADADTGTRRVTRSPGGGTRVAAAKLNDQFAAQRYAYFKSHRQSLPPTISEHSDEITELMKKGVSVEDAFGEVVKKHY